MKSLTLILSVFIFSFFTTAEPVSKQVPSTSSNTRVVTKADPTYCGIALEAGFVPLPRVFTSSGTTVTGHFGMKADFDIPSYSEQFYGTLGVDCRPGEDVFISDTYAGYAFHVYIKTDGKIYFTYIDGGVIPADTYINFSGISFSK